MTSTLFTRTLIKGLADGMSDGGRMAPFQTDDLAIGVFDKIATDLKLPPVLTEPLPDDMYIKIGQWLINASEEAVKQGFAPSASVQAMAKQASHMPLRDRALKIAEFMMQKTAEDASLNGTGANTPESATQTSALAALDQKNRSSLQYLVGQGKTDMPEGGVTGKQMPHPMAPQGPGVSNSLARLDKQAQEKVARATAFVQNLAARDADVSSKLVLASAALAEGGTDGLEVMAHIVQTVKTAEELDGMLDHVMSAQDEHGTSPDPELVAAIEHVLAQHGLLGGGDEGGEEMPGDVEEDLGGGDDDGEGDPKIAAARKVAATLAGKAKNVGKTVSTAVKKNVNKAKGKAQDLGASVAATAKKHGPAAAAGAGVGATVGAIGGAAAMNAVKGKEKEAALLATLKAAADGSLNNVGENTPESAAKTDANAALDADNRSKDEYLKGNGKTDMPNVGQIGASMDAPKGPDKVNPDNTATRETKSASFTESVKAAAAAWGGKLPATMSQSEKRAHVIAIAGMPEEMRADYVAELRAS